jgi:site-specific DNA recombinase
MTESRPVKQTVRCAIYTRKSTEEGLEQEFNSLDAQRESGEAYITSQAQEGWTCLDTRYDDGGFTGGNIDRPALRRLVADIEAHKIDCVVVYKVDRLSRSLLDFARLIETFDKYRVSFVSVTQQFNTASSMGRLILNVLLSFAQFEREIVSERTRDKIAAARRKGKWSGGMPVLGYDLVDSKLAVNEPEAERVRQIFSLYIERQSLSAVVRELAHRGWTNKLWTTRKGTTRGGRPLTKGTLHQFLTNVTFTGRVRHKRSIFDGEHRPIIDQELFDKVQEALLLHSRGRGRPHSRHSALLGGLLRCAACGCAMVHSFSSHGAKRYRYYVCSGAQRRGWSSCPAPSVPAAEIERFVIDEIRAIASEALNENPTANKLAAALMDFASVWDSRSPREQARFLKNLVGCVVYDGRRQKVSITFREPAVDSPDARPLACEEDVSCSS